MRAGAGVTEKGADLFGSFLREDVFELAGLLLDLGLAVEGQAVSEQALGQAMTANNVGGALASADGEFHDPDTPPVAPVFFAFRAMVGTGVMMIALAWYGLWATRRGTAAPKWLLWVFAGFTFSGWVAVVAGWLVTEIGRQPWLVTGILRTAEATGAASGAKLGASLTGYILTYTLMLIAYMVVLTHLAGKGGARDDTRHMPGATAGARS